MCHAVGPDVYPLDEDGYTTLDGDIVVRVGLEDQARRGAMNCPERVFTITDE